MLKTLKQIAEGWGQVVADELGLLDEETQKMASERLKKCEKCPLRSETNWCSSFKEHEGVRGCGCHLIAASKVKDKECPRGLW